MKKCIYCESDKIKKTGKVSGEQQYRCDDCKRAFTKNSNPNRNLIINGKKFCTRCESFKLLSEFNYYKGSPRSKCKECFTYDNNQNSRFKKYNITKEVFNEMLINQDNKCEICNNTFKTNKHTYIDHDHISGNVRGLLCPRCNMLLGKYNDNIDLLMLAITYFKKYHRTGSCSKLLPVL